FIATNQVQARSIEDVAIAPAQSGATAIALDQETLKRALLGLSPAEKLRIAGDRIRLANSKVQSTQHTAGRTTDAGVGESCGAAAIAFAWPPRPRSPPHPARARSQTHAPAKVAILVFAQLLPAPARRGEHASRVHRTPRSCPHTGEVAHEQRP